MNYEPFINDMPCPFSLECQQKKNYTSVVASTSREGIVTLLEPTPIDPTKMVTVPSVPFDCSPLCKIVDEGFLAAKWCDILKSSSHDSSSSSSFSWSASATTTIMMPSTTTMMKEVVAPRRPKPMIATSSFWLDLVDEVESIQKEHIDELSAPPQSTHNITLWSEKGIEELRKIALEHTMTSDHHESHSGLLNHHDSLRQNSSSSKESILLLPCSPEASCTTTINMYKNQWSSRRSVVSAENDHHEEDWGNYLTGPFRINQSQQWHMQYLDMVNFREKYGHCLVPLNWPTNPSLAHWVKRQRYQYRAKQENKHSTLTDDRQVLLERLGFVWDSHALGWQGRWTELREFKQKYGHCRVPKNYSANPQLAVWVKCQRRQFKLFSEGRDSNMTKERFDKLVSLGFVFAPRKQEAVLSFSKPVVVFPPGYGHGGVLENLVTGLEFKNGIHRSKSGLFLASNSSPKQARNF